MAEWADWILVAAALVATTVTVLPRSGRRGGRLIQVMGFLLLSTLVALIWVRLSSLDVALAEAALGGGLLGAVLVFIAAAPRRQEPLAARSGPWLAAALGAVAGAVLIVVISAVWLRVEQTMPNWAGPLEDHMPIGVEQAGSVSHEVTGVLLAFRAYDTLLESAVLMMAGVAALALRREASLSGLAGAGSRLEGADSAPASADSGPAGAVLSAQTSGFVWLVRLSAPVLLLAGLWLLFAGSTDSGGAFQSGAVLAAMLILLRVAGAAPRWPGPGRQELVLGLALVVGVVVFIAAGALGPLLGQPWLSWDPQWAFAAILTVEILLTAGIAAGLFAIFVSLEDRAGVVGR